MAPITSQSLQLGRGLSTAETTIPAMIAYPSVVLQLGRGCSTAETSTEAYNKTTAGMLQLGRGLSTAETGLWKVSHKIARPASIGPRSFNRGNTSTRSTRRGPATGFNWAAVFQPRKLSSWTTVSSSLPRFNWAAVLQPRKHPSSLVSASASCSFNWAAVFQPRKPASSLFKLAEPPASIGPRSFNRGNLSENVASNSTSSRFNWAAVLQPRKRKVSAHAHLLQYLLQLGRGLSTAGTPHEIHLILATFGASIGPRSFNRGNQTVRADPRWKSWGFNWAAVFQPRKHGKRGL